MAVEAVASVVIQKVTDMLNEEAVVFDKVIRQVEEIRIKLRDMRGFLIYAEENQARDRTVKKWADDYLLLLYHVEDIIETFSLRIARQRKTSPVITKLAAAFFFLNNLKACKKLRRNISDFGNDITELNRGKPDAVRDASVKYLLSDRSSFQDRDDEPKEDKAEHEVEEDKEEVEEEDKVSAGPSFGENLSQSAAKTLSFSYQEEDLRNFGFQDDLKDLVKQLTSSDDDDERLDNNGSSSSCNNILSIVGEEGSGKTTLASAIYKSKRIKDRFKCRAWVCVCEDHDDTTRDILLALLKQVGTSKDVQGLQNPEQELLARLKQVDNYLIVLDNVHDSGVWSWSELRDAFPDRGNRSKIIITTRDKGIVPAGSPLPHSLNGLSDKESWTMFLKKAHVDKESWTMFLKKAHIYPSQEPDEFERLQEKIIKICRGLPLRIALLGGLLFTKKVSGEEWPKVLDLILEQKHHSASDILSFCYNDLPAHLKLCLLYLTLFPKDFDIPVRRLVRLWLAEGFVKQSSTTKMPEDVAEEYFHDLVNRNLIQISKFRSDGSPRKCCLPSALHSYLLPKTQDIGLFHVHRCPDCTCNGCSFGIRRIVEYLDIKDRNLSSLQNLRSYISFNLQKKDIPAKKVKDFVSRITGHRGFGLLRVLDLEGVYKPSLPDKLGDLFHLRYLGLRWTFLDNLPASVGDLLYLETLDLKRTCINSLPDSIWKLKHLRHLNLNEIRLGIPRAPQTKLITLWGLFVDDKSLLKNGFNFDKLHDLRELGITFNLSEEYRKVLPRWISNLSSLQSLRLRSKDERCRPSALPWKSLSGLNKLSNLNLLGGLDKLPSRYEFPPELKVLTLSVSHLDKDPMPVLGQLKNLTVLRLLANSYTGKKIVCPLGGFSNLAVLKLWMLKNLEEWELKEGAMKNLKELDIRCCDKLRTLPFDQQQLSALEEITLTNMPQPFVNEVRQNKSDNTSLTVNNNWKFTPLPWEEEDNVSNGV